MGTVTLRSGGSFRATVTVTSLPSGTVYEPCSKLTLTGLSSSSAIVRTTFSGWVTPALLTAVPLTVTSRSPV